MGKKKEKEEVAMEVSGLEFEANLLPSACVELAKANVLMMEREESPDLVYIGLVKKARRYLDLLLDRAIKRHEED
uniref:Uncharacterized protein n=1 Tax=viral metagenome TaxID=1070528 RepID=A0A6M3LW26_9ZZZZ